MQSFNQFIAEEIKVSQSQLNELEKLLDSVFKKIGMDIEFTKHFLDRVNDPRNGEQIKIRELRDMFRKTFLKYKDSLTNHDNNWQAVLKDIQTSINLPFVLKWNERKGEVELVAKTVMRKKDFRSSNQFLPV